MARCILLQTGSAGLDPISSRRLDDLILELRESLGTTIVVVTHELASIFNIGNNSVFLDAEKRTMIAQGHPRERVIQHAYEIAGSSFVSESRGRTITLEATYRM